MTLRPLEHAFGPVPLAAGLLFFAAFLRADGFPPGRSVAPDSVSGAGLSAYASPAPAGQNVEAALDEQDSRLRDLDGRLKDQAGDLSRVAGTLDQTSAALAATAQSQARLAAAFDGLRERIESLERKTLALDEAQASSAVSDAGERTRQQALVGDILALKRGLAADQAGLAGQTAQLQAARAALERLDGMEELLAMVKRDVETNDEELVEVKQTLKRLEPVPTSVNAVWWQDVLDYKYLPAVATGLAVVALCVAAAQH